MSVHDMAGMNSIWGTSRQLLGGYVGGRPPSVDVGTTSIDNKTVSLCTMLPGQLTAVSFSFLFFFIIVVWPVRLGAPGSHGPTRH